MRRLDICSPQLYREEPSGKLAEQSEICACRSGLELLCALIEEVAVKPCNTQDVFYSHDSPYYSPYRGGCVCYSGDFICAKEDFTRGFKPDQAPTGSVCLLEVVGWHGRAKRPAHK